MVARWVGAELTCSCTQLGLLADLLRNRVASRKRHTAGHIPWLELWSAADTVTEKLGSQVTPGDGRREGPQLAVTQILPGLVRELVCVESWVLVRNGLPQIRGIHSKKTLSPCARTSSSQ